MHISHPNLTGDQMFKNLMAVGSHPENRIIAINCLVDFDEICMAMHISLYNAVDDHKFDTLKIQHCRQRPS